MYVIGVFLVTGLYDLIAINYGAKGASISQFLESWKQHPYCMIVVGVILCHFFGWTMSPSSEDK
jgi:hypothetical protein